MRTFDIPLRGEANTFFRVRLSDEEFAAWRDYLVAGDFNGPQPAPASGELVNPDGQVVSLAIVTDFGFEQTSKGLALVIEVTDVDGGIYTSVPIR